MQNPRFEVQVVYVCKKANSMQRQPSFKQTHEDQLSDSMQFFNVITREVNYDREFFYDTVIGYLKYLYFTLNLKSTFKNLFKSTSGGRLFFRNFIKDDCLIDARATTVTITPTISKEMFFFDMLAAAITPGLRLEVATALFSIPTELNIPTIHAVRRVAAEFFAPIMQQCEWKLFWEIVVAEQCDTKEASNILLQKIQGTLLYRLLLSVTEVIKDQKELNIHEEPLPDFSVAQIKLISKILASEKNHEDTLKSIQAELIKSQITDPFNSKDLTQYLGNLTDSGKNNLQLTLNNYDNTFKLILTKPEFIILTEAGHIALNNHLFEMFKALTILPNARKEGKPGIKAFAKLVLAYLNATYGLKSEYESLVKTVLPLYEKLVEWVGKKALKNAKPLQDKIHRLQQTGTPILSLADREPSSSHIVRTGSSDKTVTIVHNESPHNRKPKEESPRHESPRVSKEGLFKKARENSANKLRALLNGEAPTRTEGATPPRDLRSSTVKSVISVAKEPKGVTPVAWVESPITAASTFISAEAPESRLNVSPRLDLSRRRSTHLTSSIATVYPVKRHTTPQPQRPTVTLHPLPGVDDNTSPRLTDSRYSQEGATHSKRNLQLLPAPLRGAVKNLKAAVTSEEKPPSPKST